MPLNIPTTGNALVDLTMIVGSLALIARIAVALSTRDRSQFSGEERRTTSTVADESATARSIKAMRRAGIGLDSRSAEERPSRWTRPIGPLGYGFLDAAILAVGALLLLAFGTPILAGF